jgi:phosphoglycerate dehydrogenase-like enzyme/CMP-N-acetylneuraminic acid synthetase
VILARGGSKGIKKKNIVKINNHPLISYSIEAAKNSKLINKIIVSSDSKEIQKVANVYGAETPFTRSKKLSSGTAYSVDALIDSLIQAEKIYKKKFNYIIELPCVAPLRDEEDIDKCLKILINKKKYDSVISYVNTGEKHPIRIKRIKNFRATNFCKEYKESHRHSRRQDFEPSYIRNGAIYTMTRDCLINKKSREGNNSYTYIMPKEKSINIDDKFDLLTAKLIIENGLCTNAPKKIPSQIFKKFPSSNKSNLLITCPTFFVPKNLLVDLKRNYNLLIDFRNKELNHDIYSKTDYWICSPCPTYKIDKQFLKKFKKIKIIVTPSTGSNHIDVTYCNQNNIKVLTLKNSSEIKNITSSSEYTFAMMLSSIRNLPTAVNYTKKYYWRDIEDNLRSFELRDKILGIIGFGRIGSNIFKYSKPFNMKSLVFDPYVKLKKTKDLTQVAKLETLCKKSDIICVCVNLTSETHNLINKKQFSIMKNGVIFINSSRGEVVNEKDLLKFLKNKKIRSSFLDVLANENKQNFKKNRLINYAN